VLSHPRRGSDHLVATIAKVAGGLVFVVAGALFLRSLPDLIRYVRMERM
jgi:hypothetical protein